MLDISLVFNPDKADGGFAYVFSSFVAASMSRSGVSLTCIPVDDVAALALTGQLPNAVITWDKDTHTQRMIEAAGVRCFNPSSAIETSDDKIVIYYTLARAGIAQPDTLAIPRNAMSWKHDTTQRWATSGFIDTAISYLGLPMVGKPAVGSFGTNVTLLHSKEEVVEYCTKFDRFYRGLLQRYVPESGATDTRVAVVGNEVVGAMRRVAADGEFRANVALGGRAEPVELDDTTRQLALDAVRAVGADFAGVDILCAGTDTPLVCEVNPSLQFAGLESVCDVDVAGSILDYVTRSLIWSRDN